MQPLRITNVILIPVAAFLLVNLGCGTKPQDEGDVAPPAVKGPKKDAGKRAGRTELETTGWGTLKGKVTFEGDKPTVADIKTRDDFKQHQDKAYCEMGKPEELLEQTWRIGSGNGLENVVVWIKPPEGKVFKLPPEDKRDWKKEVTIDQPHCAFEPHVTVLFPAYYDVAKKSQVPSGQVFKILNGATIKHNTKWGGSQLRNPEKSETLDAKKGDKPAELKVELQPDTQYISFICDIHKWMKAYAWAFDHPYAAVTDKDGNFEIKNVPAGAEVEIDYWHESFGTTPKEKEKKKLEAGENVVNITVKK